MAKNLTGFEKFMAVARLKSQLRATDYKTLKYVDGKLTEEEYAPIKEEREALREQIRALID